MIDIEAKQFRDLPSWQPPEELLKLEFTTPTVLAEFIHGCSPDPATRTVATAALVLSLWQLGGRRLTPHVPSMILINSGKAGADPIDEFIRGLVYDEEAIQPREPMDWPDPINRSDPIVQPKDAPALMTSALHQRRKLGWQPGGGSYKQACARNLQEHYRAAQLAGFGYGRCRPYSKAWHVDSGLITDRDNEILLRLNQKADRNAFRKHVLDDPGKLLHPEGIGADLATVPKSISLSGALPVGLWDDRLAANLVALGLPIFSLPHLAEESLVLKKRSVIESLGKACPDRLGPPVETPLRLPPSDWVSHYQSVLRKRLARLPATFEFAVLQAVHQLGGVCERIASFADREAKAKPEEIIALLRDLYAHALRGMVIGIAGLAWHGIGFDLGCPQKKALKVLGSIRGKGPMRLTELLFTKGARIDAATRDTLLERLVSEDLVRVEGKTVIAATCAEFVAALHSRPELPEADNYRELVDEDGKASA